MARILRAASEKVTQIWVAIKTFFSIQWNARATAIVLDDCTRAMGLMDKAKDSVGYKCKHCEKPGVVNVDPGMWLMPSTKRSELVNRACWHALPRWKWRND